MKALVLTLLVTTVSFAAVSQTMQRAVDEMFDEEKPFNFQTLYGSADAYAAVVAAEKMEAYRIDADPPAKGVERIKTVWGYNVRSGPKDPPPEIKDQLHRLLLAPDTFWGRGLCVPHPGALLRVRSGQNTINFLFCFECHMIEIVRNDETEAITVNISDASYKPLLFVFQQLFPDDDDLKTVAEEPKWVSLRQKHEINIADASVPWSGTVIPSETRPKGSRRYTSKTNLMLRFYGNIDHTSEFHLFYEKLPKAQSPRVIPLKPGEVKFWQMEPRFKGGPVRLEYKPFKVNKGHIEVDVTIE